MTLVDETRTLVKDYEQQYQDGLITQQEKYNKVIDAWSALRRPGRDAMMEEISATPKLGERPPRQTQLDLHDGRTPAPVVRRPRSSSLPACAA